MRLPSTFQIVLFVVLLSAGAARGTTSSDTITVLAVVDGDSRLILKDSIAWWHHLRYAAPGTLEKRKQPTVINERVWFPVWHDSSTDYEHRHCNCLSDTLVVPGMLIGRENRIYELRRIVGRARMDLFEIPSKENDYALVVQFRDPYPRCGPYVAEIIAHHTPPAPAARDSLPATENSYRGLVARYDLDGDSRDGIGEYHGELHGVVASVNRFGRKSGALAFDGVDDYIEIGRPPRVDNRQFSLSVWVKVGSVRGTPWCNGIVCQDDGEGRRFVQLSMLDSSFCWHRFGRHPDAWGLEPATVGSWHQVAVTVDDTVHTLYIDGAMHDRTVAPFEGDTTLPLHIGRKGSNEKEFFFHGSIDDLRIFDRCLDHRDAKRLFDLERAAAAPPATAKTRGTR